MKRRGIILSVIGIILVSSLLIVLVNKNTKKTFMQDGVLFALTLNGKSITAFPDGHETGKYSVAVDCENAKGIWLRDEDDGKWKLVLENVNGKVSCYLDFKDVNLTVNANSGSNYLNVMIKDMAVEGTYSGAGQETGDVVHEVEKITVDNSTFTPSTTLSESDYTITTMETTSDSKNAFIWDSSASTWTSQNHTDSTTSGVGMTFTVPEGYYQLCYRMGSEKNYDYGIVYIDGTKKFETKGKDTNTYCEYLGKITTSNEIKVTYLKDSSGSTSPDNIVFYLQSGTYVEDITTDSLDTGYRYEGKSPNNYIWYNNELWRIIGVFDTCTALDDSGNCTTTETLTKIMRDESIGGLVWNKSSNNNWPSSSLYNLLNTNYLNSTNGTDSGYCYGYSTTVKANCDYSEIGLKGINSYYGSMIKNVVWNLGGMSTTSGAENYYASPASTWYTYERGTIVYSGRDTKTTGYIGLMYGSDYGYSVKASSNCNRSKTLYSYNTAYCASESWMYGQGYEWMISPSSNGSNNAWYVRGNGDVTGGNVNVSDRACAVRPVLYLDSSVYVINGEEENVGSISNPYQIAK